FPPPSLTPSLTAETVRGFVQDISQNQFLEGACAVCAQPIPRQRLKSMSSESFDRRL
ncbi:hypothetical protein OH77DRAFT_1369127, partial [Trametes cingulata]